MKSVKIYQVDALTDKIFSGNPTAVCILDTWISDELMQSIANENNLAETAFVVPKGEDFEIRWLTPAVEVDLCGHATLGSAHTSLLPVWAKKMGKNQFVANQLSTRGGQLVCEFKNDRCLIGGKARLYLTGELTLD